MSKWIRRVYEAPGLTQYPPGPDLASVQKRFNKLTQVYVTTSGSDNIGEILAAMNVKFKPFQGAYDCAVLFVNCGTSDRLDPAEVAAFVSDGGCLYASDHADDLIDDAFPGLFKFGGHNGDSGRIPAEVVDPELQEVVGAKISLEFDMGIWAKLKRCEGDTLLRKARLGPGAGAPLMVHVSHGRGSIFYTCFHNSAQASKQEKGLLQLLVLKQFGAKSHRSIEETGRAMGVSLDAIRRDLA